MDNFDDRYKTGTQYVVEAIDGEQWECRVHWFAQLRPEFWKPGKADRHSRLLRTETGPTAVDALIKAGGAWNSWETSE